MCLLLGIDNFQRKLNLKVGLDARDSMLSKLTQSVKWKVQSVRRGAYDGS